MITFANEKRLRKNHYFNLPNEERYFLSRKEEEEIEKQKYFEDIFKIIDQKAYDTEEEG
ncbi:hypothetical protein [Halobacillus litoralis]|uniref:hypothetical protein n=1 Tax=Halobacillus litoralis TaxID=45668 RepID=UPI001CFC86EA|nr:hypothetical protein [Halobacillus litoralis]